MLSSFQEPLKLLAMKDAKQVPAGIAQYVDAVRLIESLNQD